MFNSRKAALATLCILGPWGTSFATETSSPPVAMPETPPMLSSPAAPSASAHVHDENCDHPHSGEPAATRPLPSGGQAVPLEQGGELEVVYDPARHAVTIYLPRESSPGSRINASIPAASTRPSLAPPRADPHSPHFGPVASDCLCEGYASCDSSFRCPADYECEFDGASHMGHGRAYDGRPAPWSWRPWNGTSY